MYVCMNVRICMFACTYVCVFVCMYVCMIVCMNVRVCIYAYMYVYIDVGVRALLPHALKKYNSYSFLVAVHLAVHF